MGRERSAWLGGSMGRRREALEDRCLNLVTELRIRGEDRRASFLNEVIPDGPIGSDEHLALLIERLDEIAADTRLVPDVRDEARALAAGARDLPSLIGRRGRVFLVWYEPPLRWRADPLDQTESGYECSWQPYTDDGDDSPDHDLYEDGPRFEALTDALEWAQRRTDWITVRPEWDPGVHYWAGRGPTMEGEPPLTPPPGLGYRVHAPAGSAWPDDLATVPQRCVIPES